MNNKILIATLALLAGCTTSSTDAPVLITTPAGQEKEETRAMTPACQPGTGCSEKNEAPAWIEVEDKKEPVKITAAEKAAQREKAQDDVKECESDAIKYSGSSNLEHSAYASISPGHSVSSRKAEIYQKCMQDRGYL